MSKIQKDAVGRLINPHKLLSPPPSSCVLVVSGDYTFHHFMQDGVDDRGWGCGYRTLQTLCSWILFRQGESTQPSNDIPSHKEVQQRLVQLGLYDDAFISSTRWIGTEDVWTLLEDWHDVPSRVFSLSPSFGDAAAQVSSLVKHFQTSGSPIMLGGEAGSARTILGLTLDDQGNLSHLLIMDPHYTEEDDEMKVIDARAVAWMPWEAALPKSMWHNLCAPFLPETK